MNNPFTKHPHEVGETYFEHMKHASGYGFCFLWLAFQSFIHAIFPWIFNGPISKKVVRMSAHIQKRLF